MEFARDGEPLDVWLMRKLGWTYEQVLTTPNHIVLEILAAQRLENERKSPREAALG